MREKKNDECKALNGVTRTVETTTDVSLQSQPGLRSSQTEHHTEPWPGSHEWPQPGEKQHTQVKEEEGVDLYALQWLFLRTN